MGSLAKMRGKKRELAVVVTTQTEEHVTPYRVDSWNLSKASDFGESSVESCNAAPYAVSPRRIRHNVAASGSRG